MRMDRELRLLMAGMMILATSGVSIVGAQEGLILEQDFESGETVGQRPSGSWYFGEGTGASCVVSDEATDVAGSPPGSYNVKFAKTGTGSGTNLTVHLKFEDRGEQIMTSGNLTATYWVYFASGQLMRQVAFRGSGPYKHYMKMVVRGDWPDNVTLEFPINGAQKVIAGNEWHKLTFTMEWEPVWPLPAEGIPASSVACRFFVDDEEHPGSPAGLLEDVVSPFGSIEFNTADWAEAVCYMDDFKIVAAPPQPEIESLTWQDGRLNIIWSSAVDVGGIPTLYQATDPSGPWTLVQGNIESGSVVDPAEAKQLFYRVGPYEESPVQRTELFADDFEGYASSDEIETLGGWTIVNGAADAAVQWQLWNTGGEPLNSESPDLVGMTENYVVSDSDFGPDSALDEELISPVIDCTGYSQVQLDFNSNMRIYEDDQVHLQITDLDLSAYDAGAGAWSEWRNVFRRDMTRGSWSSESPRSFSLSPFADGRQIKLRWRFYDAVYDYWWAIDDVKVTGE